MGGFFIIKKPVEQLVVEDGKQIFTKKGFSQPHKIETTNWLGYLYPKTSDNQILLVRSKSTEAFCIGTVIYRRRWGIDAINLLLEDFVNRSFDEDQIIGSYCIGIITKERILLISDHANIQSLFYNRSKTVFTSSFLAAKAVTKENSPNQLAVAENLLTGHLIGPDTPILNIFRLEPECKITNLGLTAKVLGNGQEITQFKNFNHAIDAQLSVLNNYFDQISDAANHWGVDSGITSGFDSRLILAFLIKHNIRHQLHSYFRENENVEVKIAKLIADYDGSTLLNTPVTHPRFLSSQNLLTRMLSSAYFCDGIIQMHRYWWEEFNTLHFRRDTLSTNRLGLSGIGGEQYRNSEHLGTQHVPVEDLVRFKLLRNVCGPVFLKSGFENELVDYIVSKLRIKLHLENNVYPALHLYKLYYSKVLIPARLGGRNNSENNISYFLSPFTDFKIANHSHGALPFLGVANRFQETMIRMTSPELAAFPSDYGYNFNDGPGVGYKLKSWIKSLIPMKVDQMRINVVLNAENAVDGWISGHSFLINSASIIEDLNMPIKWELVKQRSDLAPLMYQMGLLLSNGIK